jgi:hypothetical protein
MIRTRFNYMLTFAVITHEELIVKTCPKANFLNFLEDNVGVHFGHRRHNDMVVIENNLLEELNVLATKLLGVDILLIPIGGTYTLDAIHAREYVEAIKPKIVIPMHFKSFDHAFDIDGIEPFERAMSEYSFTHLGADTLPITRATLDGIDETKIIVLERKRGFSK